MANKKSEKGKGYYAVYKSREQYSRNVLRKLTKHLKKHPDDEQAKERLNQINKDHTAGWKRYIPNNKGGWVKLQNFPKKMAEEVIPRLTSSQMKGFVEKYFSFKRHIRIK